MEFLDPALEAYAENHTSPEPPAAAELNRQTHLKVLQPRMLSGHLQGRLLSMMAHMARPEQILEIGTYTGYSAICLAEGMREGGTLHTIDIDEELRPMAERYFEKANCADRIRMHTGAALEVIDTLDGPFDLVFIDADKTNYLNYYKAVFSKVPVGGYIIADNVLWSGKVLDPAEALDDPDTAALMKYNEAVLNDPKTENVLLPVRDGLMIARKIAD